MTQQTIQFLRNGQIVRKALPSASYTLLELLREELGATSAKEGCGEGDCGACTVVLGSLQDGKIAYQAINACIRLASSIDGMALWTAQDIARQINGTVQLHPVQQALVENHASQCGFCTPGFVMSLFAFYQNRVRQDTRPITRTEIEQTLSGNLCRCTGYRAIVDAALSLDQYPQPVEDSSALISALQSIAVSELSLATFLQTKQKQPQAQIVAGATDVGLWITKRQQHFETLLDTTRVAELKLISEDDQYTHIGAAVSLSEAFDDLQATRPELTSFFHRFAALPVRNSGTLGGNIANGSPIGDSMPLLIALAAEISLSRWDGAGQKIQTRRMPLEKLYTGYRSNVLLADELLTAIHVPRAKPDALLRAYKVSKRFEDDIAAVCLALQMQIENERVVAASIGVGGVAAVPARATQTEAAIIGEIWNESTVQNMQDALLTEFTPISDMRASSSYRSQLLAQLVQRYWLESKGMLSLSLADSDYTIDINQNPAKVAAS